MYKELKEAYKENDSKKFYHMLNRIKMFIEDTYVEKVKVENQIIVEKKEVDEWIMRSCINLYSSNEKIKMLIIDKHELPEELKIKIFKTKKKKKAPAYDLLTN